MTFLITAHSLIIAERGLKNGISILDKSDFRFWIEEKEAISKS
jgi:hypothetical protein